MATPFNLVGEITFVAKGLAQLQAQLQQAVGNVGQNVTVNFQAGSVQNVANATGAIQQNINKVNNAAKQANTTLGVFGDTLVNRFRTFTQFTIVSRIIGSITNAFSEGFSSAIKFQDSLIKLQQITGSTATSVQAIGDEIVRLATTFGASSEQLSRSADTLAQAGLAAKDTKIALEALAQASLSPTFKDMNVATEGLIATFGQFNKTASDAKDILGGINAVSKAFAVESDDIIKGIQRAGGAFAAAGGSVEEFIGLFTSVRQTTRESAESIATGIRTITGRLQRLENTEALRKLGIDLRDAQGNFVGVFQAVERLNQGLANVNTQSAEFASIVESLGGLRQTSRFIPLVQNVELARQARDIAIRGSASLATDAEKAQESLLVQIRKVREQFLTLFNTIINSKGFKDLTSSILVLTSALISLAKVATPLLPTLVAFAGIRLLSPAFSAAAGLGGALGAFPGVAFGGGGSLLAQRPSLSFGPNGASTQASLLERQQFITAAAFNRRLPVGLALGGSILASLLGNAIQPDFNDPTLGRRLSNNPTLSRHLSLQSSLGGTLTGAGEGLGIGALIGSAIAPGIGTAIGGGAGALIGGVAGFASAAEEAARTLRETELNFLIEKFGQSLERLSKSLSTASVELSENIKVAERLTKLTPKIGDKDRDSFILNQRQQLVNFSIFTDKFAEELLDRFGFIGDRAKLNGKQAKDIPEVVRARNQFLNDTRNIATLRANFDNTLPSEEVDKLGKRLNELAERRSRNIEFDKLNKDTRELNETFKIFINEVKIATEEFKDLNISSIKLFANIAGGRIGSSLPNPFSQLRSDIIPAFLGGAGRLGASVGGANGDIAEFIQNLTGRAGAGKVARNNLTNILENARNSGLLSINLGQFIKDQLTEKFKEARVSGPGGEFITDKILNKVGRIDIEDLTKKLDNIEEFTNELLRDLEQPIDRLKELADEVNKRLSEFSAGLADVERGLEEVNKNIHETELGRLNSARLFSNLTGIGLTSQVLEQPLNNRFNFLTRSVGRDANISQIRDKIFEDINKAVIQRQNFIQNPNAANARAIVDTESEIQTLVTALKELTDISKRNSAIQERLSNLQEKANIAGGIGRTVTTGSASDRFQLGRTIRDTLGSIGTGNFNRLPFDRRGNVLEFLGRFGQRTLGGERADIIGQKLQENFLKSLGLDEKTAKFFSGALEDEGKQLQRRLIDTQNAANNANTALTDVMTQLHLTIRENLIKTITNQTIANQAVVLQLKEDDLKKQQAAKNIDIKTVQDNLTGRSNFIRSLQIERIAGGLPPVPGDIFNQQNITSIHAILNSSRQTKKFLDTFNDARALGLIDNEATKQKFGQEFFRNGRIFSEFGFGNVGPKGNITDTGFVDLLVNLRELSNLDERIGNNPGRKPNASQLIERQRLAIDTIKLDEAGFNNISKGDIDKVNTLGLNVNQRLKVLLDAIKISDELKEKLLGISSTGTPAVDAIVQFRQIQKGIQQGQLPELIEEFDRLKKLTPFFEETLKFITTSSDKQILSIQNVFNSVDDNVVKVNEHIKNLQKTAETLASTIEDVRKKHQALREQLIPKQPPIENKVPPPGIIQKTKAEGGVITGGIPGRDSVPALLMQDEFVVRASEARKHRGLLHAINSGKFRGFADGGEVNSNSSSKNLRYYIKGKNGEIIPIDLTQDFDNLGEYLQQSKASNTYSMSDILDITGHMGKQSRQKFLKEMGLPEDTRILMPKLKLTGGPAVELANTNYRTSDPNILSSIRNLRDQGLGQMMELRSAYEADKAFGGKGYVFWSPSTSENGALTLQALEEKGLMDVKKYVTTDNHDHATTTYARFITEKGRKAAEKDILEAIGREAPNKEYLGGKSLKDFRIDMLGKGARDYSIFNKPATPAEDILGKVGKSEFSKGKLRIELGANPKSSGGMGGAAAFLGMELLPVISDTLGDAHDTLFPSAALDNKIHKLESQIRDGEGFFGAPGGYTDERRAAYRALLSKQNAKANQPDDDYIKMRAKRLRSIYNEDIKAGRHVDQQFKDTLEVLEAEARGRDWLKDYEFRKWKKESEAEDNPSYMQKWLFNLMNPGAQRYASGGRIPGRGTGDIVPALLTPGEFVVNAKDAQKHMGLLHRINSGGVQKFADGGPVKPIKPFRSNAPDLDYWEFMYKTWKRATAYDGPPDEKKLDVEAKAFASKWHDGLERGKFRGPEFGMPPEGQFPGGQGGGRPLSGYNKVFQDINLKLGLHPFDIHEGLVDSFLNEARKTKSGRPGVFRLRDLNDPLGALRPEVRKFGGLKGVASKRDPNREMTVAELLDMEFDERDIQAIRDRFNAKQKEHLLKVPMSKNEQIRGMKLFLKLQREIDKFDHTRGEKLFDKFVKDDMEVLAHPKLLDELVLEAADFRGKAIEAETKQRQRSLGIDPEGLRLSRNLIQNRRLGYIEDPLGQQIEDKDWLVGRFHQGKDLPNQFGSVTIGGKRIKIRSEKDFNNLNIGALNTDNQAEQARRGAVQEKFLNKQIGAALKRFNENPTLQDAQFLLRHANKLDVGQLQDAQNFVANLQEADFAQRFQFGKPAKVQPFVVDANKVAHEFLDERVPFAGGVIKGGKNAGLPKQLTYGDINRLRKEGYSLEDILAEKERIEIARREILSGKVDAADANIINFSKKFTFRDGNQLIGAHIRKKEKAPDQLAPQKERDIFDLVQKRKAQEAEEAKQRIREKDAATGRFDPNKLAAGLKLSDFDGDFEKFRDAVIKDAQKKRNEVGIRRADFGDDFEKFDAAVRADFEKKQKEFAARKPELINPIGEDFEKEKRAKLQEALERAKAAREAGELGVPAPAENLPPELRAKLDAAKQERATREAADAAVAEQKRIAIEGLNSVSRRNDPFADPHRVNRAPSAAGIALSREELDEQNRRFYQGLFQRGIGFANGGRVPSLVANVRHGLWNPATGDMGTDTVPAMLTPGEVVINKQAAQKYGYERLNKINRGYAEGGVVNAEGTVNGNLNAGIDVKVTESMTQLSRALQSFMASSDRLAKAMEAFPNTINMDAKHTVEVVFNGAEVLSSLSNDLAELAVQKAREEINSMLSDKFPDAGQVEV